MEILQSSLGGKIFLLFLDTSLLLLSRLLPILLSRENSCKNAQFNQNRLSKIEHYIQLHLNENIKEKELADFLGMSTGHFSRFFRKTYQCSFVEYLNHYKVNFAAKLLKESNLQIIDNCHRSSFSSQTQLKKKKKKQTKMTPNEYREQYRQG
jgi:AraC-like DNA-binding protein